VKRKKKNLINPQGYKTTMAQNLGKHGCRLCLAPENECVSIFKTQAADKQPINIKINSCVQIQVSENYFDL
jgi:hypothetical protein